MRTKRVLTFQGTDTRLGHPSDPSRKRNDVRLVAHGLGMDLRSETTMSEIGNGNPCVPAIEHSYPGGLVWLVAGDEADPGRTQGSAGLQRNCAISGRHMSHDNARTCPIANTDPASR